MIGEFPSTFIASFCAMIMALSQKKVGFKRIGSLLLSILLSVMAGFLLITYWIGCVMISRIIMGAHFLSDVTVGMAISLVLFYVFCKKHSNLSRSV